MQWLPYKWRYQAGYLIYRWIMVVYFFSWQLASGVVSDGPNYFIYLTNWAFIVLNLYLLVAAISSTTKYLIVHFLRPNKELSLSKDNEYTVKKPLGRCGYTTNTLNWYQMIHWLLFTLSADSAFTITFLYWALLYNGGAVSGTSANTHLINGIMMIVDLWVSGVPIQILHFYYPVIFGAVYGIFTGIHFSISGVVIYDGVLEYAEALGSAVGTVVALTFIFIPLVHMIFYLQYLVKFWILYRIFHQKQEVRVEDGGLQPIELNHST